MKLIYSKKNIISGALIFCIGDTIASIVANEFSVLRVIGISIIGATIYAFEIPNVFIWIEKKTPGILNLKKGMYRGLLATLYFNPLWIARHLLFIQILLFHWEDINLSLLAIAWNSFIINIPFVLVINYLIQTKITMRWRFIVSSAFSGVMAVYYAISEQIFG